MVEWRQTGNTKRKRWGEKRCRSEKHPSPGGALHCFDGGGGTDGSIAWPTVLFVFQPLPFYYLIIIILFSVVSLATGENTGRPATARKLKSIRTSCIHEDIFLARETSVELLIRSH